MKVQKIHRNNYIVKQLPTATVYLNRKFEIIHASDQWANEFENDSIDILGKNIFDQIHTEASSDLKNLLILCLEGKSTQFNTEWCAQNDDLSKWFEWSITPWYDDNENIIGAIVQVQNISLHVQVDQRFHKLESLLREKAEFANIGIWEFDPIKEKVWWCERTKAIHGVSDAFVPTFNNIIDFYKPGYSRNSFALALENAATKGASWNEKLQIITPEGIEKWIITTGSPTFKNKKFTGLLGSFQDISQTVEIETRTKENERLLQTLIDNLPLNVYIKDTESRKILVNKSEADYVGLGSRQELLGKNDFDVYDHKTAKIGRNEDLWVMKNRKSIMSKEDLCIKKDGTETIFSVSKIPYIDENNEIAGIIGMSIDITDIKQKERELKDLINVTSLQNKKLIDFAHIVSHNLRSHTANFSMLLDFLTHEKNEDEKSKIMKMLTDSSDSLLETLDNLNEVVAINTNVNQEKKKVALKEKVEQVESDLQAFLTNNNALIINQIPQKLVIKVVPDYLESILMNFITNSVKYSNPERRPVIVLTTENKNGYTVLSIADNGSGIDLKKYGDKLFGMYKTFHDHKDSRGIGLYISKNQIEAMNGKVEVESAVGKGTTFKIYFNEKD
ncbi:PAS domain S-box protein [Maribacter algicola]|uniref:PAS domain S-box protein n=1 Tax=Meishania litoralis TaxID=3434685 RepID=A0ACC7LNG6_9FLAO